MLGNQHRNHGTRVKLCSGCTNFLHTLATHNKQPAQKAVPTHLYFPDLRHQISWHLFTGYYRLRWHHGKHSSFRMKWNCTHCRNCIFLAFLVWKSHKIPHLQPAQAAIRQISWYYAFRFKCTRKGEKSSRDSALPTHARTSRICRNSS